MRVFILVVFLSLVQEGTGFGGEHQRVGFGIPVFGSPRELTTSLISQMEQHIFLWLPFLPFRLEPPQPQDWELKDVMFTYICSTFLSEETNYLFFFPAKCIY